MHPGKYQDTLSFRNTHGEDRFVRDGQSLGSKTKTIAEFFSLDLLEGDLGLSEGFFNELLDENDWSFIIKLHALIEAVVTHLLVLHFNEPNLDSIFSSLQFNNLRTGKLAFAKGVGLIDTDTERYIQRLSQLRNVFVHDVANVNNSIKDLLDACDKNKEIEFRKGFLFGYQDGQKIQVKVDKNLYNSIAMIQAVSVALYKFIPKLSIWFGAIIILSNFYNTALPVIFDFIWWWSSTVGAYRNHKLGFVTALLVSIWQKSTAYSTNGFLYFTMPNFPASP